MNVIQLNDGSIEIIGSYNDIIDIIRNKCGDDLANILSENDPGDWDNVIDAENEISSAQDILQATNEDNLLTGEQIEQVKNKIDSALERLLQVL